MLFGRRTSFISGTILMVCCAAGLIRCDTNYTLLMPSQAVAGRTMRVQLAVFYRTPAAVTIIVTRDGENTDYPRQSASINGDGALNELNVMIPVNWTSGDYTLTLSNNLFRASANFEVSSAPYAILIQTDKPIYKPSQTVNLRVAIIDDNLIPVNERIDVVIEDAEGSKIQQWRNTSLQNGLAQFSLPLSDRPPLGDWKITVTTDVKEQEKMIKIDEYVLPRFEVIVDLQSYILAGDKEVTTSISAQYTFGENVVGEMNVIFRTDNDDELRKSNIQIDGRARITLDMNDVAQLGLSLAEVLTVTAEVYEPLSGKTLSGSGSTTVAQSDYVITFMDVNSKNYRPEQNYTAYFDVARPDGTRIKGESNVLVITVKATSVDVTTTTTRLPVPDSGIVAASLMMPSSESYSVTLEAQLVLADNEIVDGPIIYDLSKFRTRGEAVFLQATANIPTIPDVGDTIPIAVTASAQSGKFFYVVTARGQVVDSGSDELARGMGSIVLSLVQSYTPQVYVVVYAVIDGELLADSISFNVEGIFRNEVTLEFVNDAGVAIDEAMPADMVKVKVMTEPNSTVALLSVDKSVLLLGGGNDITQSQIQTEMLSLIKSSSNCNSGEGGDDHGGGVGFFRYPRFGGKSTEDILAAAGLSVSTDGEMANCYDYDGDIVFEMAMPGAYYDDDFSAPGAPQVPESDESGSPKRRQFFPETWLWDLVLSDDGGMAELQKTVPDTITSWVSTAISMHPTAGIAVTARSSELTVKLPFFITAILPYSAVKSEELLLKIVVNNYGDADDVCTVTVDRSEQYEVKESENHLYLPDEDLVLPAVSVAQGAGAVVSVWLNPLVVDTIQISASATCTSGNEDGFKRDLLIKPAGFPQETCETELIQIELGGDNVVHTFNTRINQTIVEDSKRVQVQVTGDVMGPSIEGLEKLVIMPYGCGEQNMVTFTPNIFVRRYLEHMNDLGSDINTQTMKYMQIGYQKELTYRHKDGSFSAFGDSDDSGSTWLTAFVMKCFRQAQAYIMIDEIVMMRAKEWLLNQISTSTVGMFNEPGKVIHTEMQGGSTGGFTLSAFVVISLLEDLPEGTEYMERVSSLRPTITYLERSLSSIRNNPYQLSIITYALQLAGSNQVDTFLEQLESHQFTSAGMIWWSLPKEGESDVDTPYYRRLSGPSSVEMTSYALLTYISRDDIETAKAISMWLTKTRGSSGGFHSTQDTVLGLQALAAYAERVVSESTNLQVTFRSNLGNEFVHTINAVNAILTKKNSFKPANGIETVTATLSGEGSAIITTCTGYNVDSVPQKPTTLVTTDVTTDKINSTKTTLVACIIYTGNGDSGMGLMQVKMATGFSAEVDGVVIKSGDLARTESTADGLALYWNTMTAEESCVDISLVKDSEVKNVQDTYVVGSQYYSTESGSRAFYNPVKARLEERVSSSTPHATISAMCVLSAMLSSIIAAVTAHILV